LLSSTVAAGTLLTAEVFVMIGSDTPKVPEFHPLPATAVGLLVGDARGLLAEEGRSGPPDALCFSSGGGNYRWVYIPVPENPTIDTLSLPVGEKGEASQKFDRLSMATRQTVKPFRVTELCTLIRVEVNGGRGSPATDRFVATKLEVLDGTAEYPIHVAAEIEKLKTRAHNILAEEGHRSAIENGMTKAEAKAAKGQKPSGKRETTEIIYVTWEPRSERLLVEVHTRISDGFLRPGRGTEPVRKGQPGAPRNPPLPGPATLHGTLFGVETGVVFEVDKAGHEVSHRVLPVQPFVKELPPLKSSVESRSPRPRPVDHGRGRHGSRQSHPHARNGTLRTGWEQELAAQAGRMHSCSSSPSILRTPGWRSKYCRDAAKVVSGVVAEVVSEPV